MPLGFPIARFGSGNRLASRSQLCAERLGRRQRGGLSAASVTEGLPQATFAPAVSFLNQRPGATAKRVVLLLMLRLQREATNLRAELTEKIVDASQVLLGAGQAPKRFVLADLEILYPGRLLEQLASFFGSQREGRIHGPLADDDQGARAELSSREQLDEVAQTNAGPIDEVLGLTRAVSPPPDRHLAEVDGQPAIGVVEGHDHLGQAGRLALLASREDHVVRASGPKGPVRLLAEHPAHGVGHVRLAASIGADDGVDAAFEHEAGRFGERLETMKAELPKTAHREWLDGLGAAGRLTRSVPNRRRPRAPGHRFPPRAARSPRRQPAPRLAGGWNPRQPPVDDPPAPPRP